MYDDDGSDSFEVDTSPMYHWTDLGRWFLENLRVFVLNDLRIFEIDLSRNCLFFPARNRVKARKIKAKRRFSEVEIEVVLK